MKFYFKKREKADVAIGRINLELRARIIRLVNDEAMDPDTMVHELRKCIKKLRAVLRFSKPALKPAAFKRTDRALRDFAREISGARDSDVLVKTFDCLSEHYRPFLETGELVPVRQALQNRHVLAMAGFQEQHDAKQLEEAFIRLELQLERGKRVCVTDAVLRSAVREVYSRGRKLHRLLDEDPNTEHSHDLRRQAKYLWYQLRLLKKRIPEPMRPVVDELDEPVQARQAIALGEAFDFGLDRGVGLAGDEASRRPIDEGEKDYDGCAKQRHVQQGEAESRALEQLCLHPGIGENITKTGDRIHDIAHMGQARSDRSVDNRFDREIMYKIRFFLPEYTRKSPDNHELGQWVGAASSHIHWYPSKSFRFDFIDVLTWRRNQYNLGTRIAYMTRECNSEVV